eukprot:gnl/TRDRNA2_/TRDRNA2_155342_c1_seq3.p3 gnl/TRDRNA2_/TRDRNA2_155342_c1~~gnl/TRDRNA2_/TRDRNA2_155342_c1_seq3.p3  ORF type:complete len:103 (-),score=27.46 gnl/TRDRNA2_/TRDRNA2_155342_c1_seq3:101-409(-)
MIQAVILVINCIQVSTSNPCREMLYVRTSKAIKLKAKAWGDVYLGTVFKFAAASFNMSFNKVEYNGGMSTIFCITWGALWMLCTCWVGLKTRWLEKSGITVE